MSATGERDRVARIAGVDDALALTIARRIGDPWFRCQALAHVAWHAADPGRFLDLVAESLASGWAIPGGNRPASVVAWPVAALARRRLGDPGDRDRADRELRGAIDRLAPTLATEPSPASRADALLLHVHALSPRRPDVRRTVLGLLADECRDPANRKRHRQVEEAARAVALDDPAAALGLAALLDEGRGHRLIARLADPGTQLGPRPFFETAGP